METKEIRAALQGMEKSSTAMISSWNVFSLRRINF